MSEAFPFWAMVPRDVESNLRFRAEVIRLMNEVPGMKETVEAMCAADFCFWAGTFMWTFNPKRRVNKVIPFIPRDYQVDYARELKEAIREGRDVCVAKSRDMGVSWETIAVFYHEWAYENDSSFLMGSRNKDYVDKPGNPKSLFWKLDFIMQHLPGSLVPRHVRTEMRLTNEDNGSTIDGESTTGDFARGDRRTAILLDEAAAFEISDGYRVLSSTQSAADCRIWVSTFQGTTGAFFEVSEKEDYRQIRLHWTLDADKARGLYQWDAERGVVKRLDPEWDYDASYAYAKDGLIRSPWYDRERRKCANDMVAGQELDMNPSASTAQYFERRLIAELLEECTEPVWIGELLYDPESAMPIKLVEKRDGRLRLWAIPDARGRLPSGTDYGIGADISAGTGASNTCISIGACVGGLKVGELADPHISPDEAGKYAHALGWFLRGPSGPAYQCWEAPGIGRVYGRQITDRKYPTERIFHRQNEEVLINRNQMMPVSRTVTAQVPGWWPTPDERIATFGHYQVALREGRLQNRSQPAIKECREIAYVDGGRDVMHVRQKDNPDPSGARSAHGDRVTGDALMWKAIEGRAEPIEHQVDDEAYGTLAWRRQEADRSDRKRLMNAQERRW